MSKKFQELDLKDAFLFSAAVQDEKTCGMILEVLLGRQVPKVTVRAEASMLYHSDFRSVRLDVYANDEMQVAYNLEMQNTDNNNLAKRSRYHQAEMDLTSLKPGEDFRELKPCYVIFICTYDPFKKGKYRYTFENRCLEEDFPLGDETTKVFLNTKGTNKNEVPEVLVNFLHYVENSTDEYVSTIEDHTIEKIHENIVQLKKSRLWEGRYMKFEEILREAEENGLKRGMIKGLEEGYQQGMEQGMQQGLEQGMQQGLEQGMQQGLEQGMQQGLEQGMQQGRDLLIKLIDCMAVAGEGNQIAKLSNSDFLQHMLQKYNLKI